MFETAFLCVAYFVIASMIITHSRPALVSRRIRVVIALILLGFPLGQALENARLTYPFQPWTLYATRRPGVVFRLYLIVDSPSLTAHQYDFGELAFSSPRAFAARLDQLINTCSCTQGDPLVDRVIGVLADIHKTRTGHDVLSYEVYELPVHASVSNVAERRLVYRWWPLNRRLSL